jgi:hypothetical protein
MTFAWRRFLLCACAALAVAGPGRAETGAKAEGFAAEGVWMYQPKDGETVELAVAADKPLFLFFKGYVVVTEVQRSAELDLNFAANMVEVRSRNRKRGQATLAVKGGDGRLFTVQVQVADPRGRPASPEIVTVR